MIKKKHRCTNSLLDDILKLLSALKVQHVPSSWFKLKQLVKRSAEAPQQTRSMIDRTVYFCSNCEQYSTDPDRCTNASCVYHGNKLFPPHTFIQLNVRQQIEEILKSIQPNDLDLSVQRAGQVSSAMRDVCHGRIYQDVTQSLIDERHRFFISLTCNIDGAAVYTSSEQSMWTFTACVNELDRSIRFDMDKIIGMNALEHERRSLKTVLLVLAVSVGRKKPSRNIVQKMLVPIVSALKELQKPILYQVADCSYQMLRTYLIGISNDKPANSLVQNQPEPNALFGCSKCEIAGNLSVVFLCENRRRLLFVSVGKTTPARLFATPADSTKIRTTYIRIFPTPKSSALEMRSNARWYDVCHAAQNGVRFFTNEQQSHTFGYLGECELSELAFIDRGSSFMSDTLHSIYHGAFVRMPHPVDLRRNQLIAPS